MEKEQYICPCCGKDITEFVHKGIILYNQKVRIVNAKQKITKEKRAKMTLESQARLRKWREEHPEIAREKAIIASRARTKETFERQAQTVRETAKKKAVKFGELVLEAKLNGVEITPELETELLEKARQIVKEENRLERLERKKSAKA